MFEYLVPRIITDPRKCANAEHTWEPIQTQPRARDSSLGSNSVQTKPNVSFNPGQTVCIHLYDRLEGMERSIYAIIVRARVPRDTPFPPSCKAERLFWHCISDPGSCSLSVVDSERTLLLVRFGARQYNGGERPHAAWGSPPICRIPRMLGSVPGSITHRHMLVIHVEIGLVSQR